MSTLEELFPEIITLNEMDEYVNLLVYGDSGVGKTVLGGSHPRALFIAPEDDGTISAKRQGSQAMKFTIDSFNDIDSVYGRLEEDFSENGAGVIRKNFDVIVIDSITHMQRLVMRQVLDDAVEDNEDRDPDIPQMQDWQKYQNMFLRFVQAFNDLPIHVLWTSLSRAEEDEEGNDFLVPDIQGKGYQMALTVASYMTSYGHMKAEEKPRKNAKGEYILDANGKKRMKTERTITWRDTGKIRGKDRTDVLAPSTTNLSLKDMLDMIEGKETRESIRARKAAEAKAAASKAPAQKAAPAARKSVQKPVSKPAVVEDGKTETPSENETDNNTENKE